MPSQKTLAEFNWREIAALTLLSRAMDKIEETRLVPEKKVLYQFSARGHEMAQIILGSLLDHKHDGVGAYYRSRPILLSLGLDPVDAVAGPLAQSGGYSDGRDIGVVCNLPADGKHPCVLPMCGDVGVTIYPGFRLGTGNRISAHRSQGQILPGRDRRGPRW